MSDDPKVTRRKLTDYIPDPRNANKGTERGQYMVDSSVEQVGAGRSLVATADGVIAAGNKTMQALVDAGILDVLEVETDGRTAVVVKRKDWAGIEDEQARKYAYFDNRASEVGLEWDIETLLTDLESGVDLSAMFHDDELDALLMNIPSADAWGDAFGALPDGERAPFQQMTFTLHDGQAEIVREAVAQAKRDCDFSDEENENSNGNALYMICRAYINGFG